MHCKKCEAIKSVKIAMYIQEFTVRLYIHFYSQFHKFIINFIFIFGTDLGNKTNTHTHTIIKKEASNGLTVSKMYHSNMN